jgi:hypothetical protein
VEDLVKARMVSKPNLLKKVLQEGEDQPKSGKIYAKKNRIKYKLV